MALANNQESTTNILLSEKFENVQRCLKELFEGKLTKDQKPERLVKLIRAAICHRNDITASRFVNAKIATLEDTMKLIGFQLEDKTEALNKNTLYRELIFLFYNQIQVLVIDFFSLINF